MAGLAQFDDALFLQGGRGAGLHTGAAAHAVGRHERLVLPRHHSGLETAALQQSIECGDDAWEANVVAAFHMLSRAETKLEEGAEGNREE